METFSDQAPQSKPFLHMAVFRNDLQGIEQLLSSGSDINIKDDLGNTALHYAASLIQNESLQLLVSKGADIDAQTFKTLETPLIKSITSWRKDPSTNHIDRTPTYFLLEHGANPNLGDYKNRTALHYAAAYNSIELVQKLLEFGADKSIHSRGFGTPLDVAIKYNNIGVATVIRDFKNITTKRYTSPYMHTQKIPNQPSASIQRLTPLKSNPGKIQKPIRPFHFGM